MIMLYDYQLDALNRMHNGCILNGGVGSGKSRTALAYYYIQYGGDLTSERFVPMTNPPKLYIITTARKRDTLEWEGELINFRINPDDVVIDSWNNIHKYKEVINGFFIFDEQRVVGYGEWSKSFIKIAKNNPWILLSATPGDTWSDYIPVFIANGFYKNKTEFIHCHAVFSRYTNFPKIERYVNEGKLIKLRSKILVKMNYQHDINYHNEFIICDYDIKAYNALMNTRWNIYKNKPIENAGELCLLLRQVVNSDRSRITRLLEILDKHNTAIIFYNYNYELSILKDAMDKCGIEYGEWNGHKHDPLPTSNRWVYIVQYTAGSEGWNCTTSNTIIFYSQNYSYKIMKQAMGRIDRLNTPYNDLYYYQLKTNSKIDRAISNALNRKKKFNEKKFIGE